MALVRLQDGGDTIFVNSDHVVLLEAGPSDTTNVYILGVQTVDKINVDSPLQQTERAISGVSS
jgi:hypothetical protein